MWCDVISHVVISYNILWFSLWRCISRYIVRYLPRQKRWWLAIASLYVMFFNTTSTLPHLTSPQLTSTHLTSPHITSPQLTSPQLNSHLTSPHLNSHHLNSHLTSPHLNSTQLTSIHLMPSPTPVPSHPRCRPNQVRSLDGSCVNSEGYCLSVCGADGGVLSTTTG